MIDSQLPTDGRIEMTAIVAVGLDSIWDGPARRQPGRSRHQDRRAGRGESMPTPRHATAYLSRHRPKIVLEIHRDVPRDDVLSPA